MKTLYLDIFSGISGDMFIGALIDLGVNARKLERELAKLKLNGYHLHVARQERQGIAGVKFDVHLAHEHHDHHHHEEPEHHHDHGHGHDHHHGDHGHQHEHGHSHTHEHAHQDEHGHKHVHTHEHHRDDSRNFSEIKKLIGKSRLSPWVKKKSLAVFQRIAEAEGKIHGMPPDEVHFHEVGAVDSIVDIVGACIGLEMLGKPRVLAAPVTEGTGWIRCAHGRFPIPAPATLAILGARRVGVTQCDEPNELVTPTGAALLAEFVEEFGPMTGIVAEQIGFGLGTRENKSRPNVLRAVLGRTGVAPVSNSKSRSSGNLKSETGATPVLRTLDWETDRIAVLETNLDDVSGEVLGQFVEAALTAGALDVFHTPIQMKKNRPGVLLTVLCSEAEADRFSEMILRQTSAFGVRRTVAERRKLQREFATVRTSHGQVAVKLGKLNGVVIQAAPEFESCKKLATQRKLPLKKVYEAAVAAASRLLR